MTIWNWTDDVAVNVTEIVYLDSFSFDHSHDLSDNHDPDTHVDSACLENDNPLEKSGMEMVSGNIW